MGKIPKTRREKEVWEACDELWEEIIEDGQTIVALTGERLKKKLVGLGYRRGNQNQLYQYRNSWQEARGIEESEELAKEERRAQLSERVQKAIANVHAEINAEAEARILAIQKEAEAKVKAAQAAKDNIERNYDVARKLQEELQSEKSKLEYSASKLTSELTTLKQQLELAQEQKKHAEESYERAQASFSVRLSELDSFNKATKEQASQSIQNLEQIHTKEKKDLIAIHEEERHVHIVEIENLRVAVNGLEKKLAKAEMSESQAITRGKELTATIKRLEQSLISANKENDDQQKRIHELEKVLATTKGELRQTQLLVADYKKDNIRAQEQIITHKEQIIRLEEEIKHLQAIKQKAKQNDQKH